MDVSALKIVAAGAGARLEIRAIPRAKRSGPKGVREGMLEVSVAAPPVDGAANEELVRALAGALGVPRRAVQIVRGETARHKVVEIEGLSPDEVRARLSAG